MKLPNTPNPFLTKWVRVAIILLTVLVVADFLGISPWKRKVEMRPVTQPEGGLGSEEKATMEVFEKVSPSVVYITNKRLQRNFFSFTVTEIPQGTGSGFLWDDEGHIVTNFHVIYQADEVAVRLQNGKSYDAQLVGADPDHDLAVLRINPANLDIPPVMIGNSKNLRVGQKVLAIGNPFGLDSTLTTGIISALGRSIKSMTNRYIHDVIQTDAAINPGNSGGPLLDSFGRLIGVNTAIISPSGSYAGVGFAVPVDTINLIATQLVNSGKVERPGLGVSLVPDHIMAKWGIEGVCILQTYKGSSAEEAGLKESTRLPGGRIELGDIIVKCDGSTVKDSSDFIKILDRHKVGDEVELVLFRDSKEKRVVVKLQAIN
ncbi:MAG: trypsin-like serine protease [Planctomycetes bacterium]|nr:trypsin-like serine protease [Planctomycetota bacterium]